MPELSMELEDLNAHVLALAKSGALSARTQQVVTASKNKDKDKDKEKDKGGERNTRDAA